MARNERIKMEISRTAAQLLFDGEVRTYRDARRQAARRFNPSASDSRGPHLPDYPEIHTELRHLFLFYDGEALSIRVKKWRQLALKYLETFEPFQPLLVGSVLRGEVREISDINLQLFCDKPEEVGYFLESEGIDFDEGGDAEDTRFYLEEDGIEIECTVYSLNERRQVPHCRITGKSLERIGLKKLEEMLEKHLS